MKSTIRILILEDNPADVELIQHELRRAGLAFTARVVETRDGFLEGLSEYDPDLVLSDQSLPRMDGVDALSLAQQFRPEVPFGRAAGSR